MQTKKNGARNGRRAVEFVTEAPSAKSVAVAGTFNDWNPTACLLNHEGNGTWKANVTLPTGRHEYCLVVDGTWICDPRATETVPNPYGGNNAVIVV